MAATTTHLSHPWETTLGDSDWTTEVACGCNAENSRTGICSILINERSTDIKVTKYSWDNDFIWSFFIFPTNYTINSTRFYPNLNEMAIISRKWNGGSPLSSWIGPEIKFLYPIRKLYVIRVHNHHQGFMVHESSVYETHMTLIYINQDHKHWYDEIRTSHEPQSLIRK